MILVYVSALRIGKNGAIAVGPFVMLTKLSGLSVCEVYNYCNVGLGHGSCMQLAGTCNCTYPYFGDSCEYSLCPDNCTDSTHGTCNLNTGECNCSKHETGVWAGEVILFVYRTLTEKNCATKYIDCPNDCSKHGDCDDLTGNCSCISGWLPPNCSLCWFFANFNCEHS